MTLNFDSKEFCVVTTPKSLKYKHNPKINGYREIVVCITLMVYGEFFLEKINKNRNGDLLKL